MTDRFFYALALADLLKPAGLMVMDYFSQRWLVHLLQYIAQFGGLCAPRGEAFAVGLAQRTHKRVAVLPVISPFLSRWRAMCAASGIGMS